MKLLPITLVIVSIFQLLSLSFASENEEDNIGIHVRVFVSLLVSELETNSYTYVFLYYFFSQFKLSRQDYWETTEYDNDIGDFLMDGYEEDVQAQDQVEQRELQMGWGRRRRMRGWWEPVSYSLCSYLLH